MPCEVWEQTQSALSAEHATQGPIGLGICNAMFLLGRPAPNTGQADCGACGPPTNQVAWSLRALLGEGDTHTELRACGTSTQAETAPRAHRAMSNVLCQMPAATSAGEPCPLVGMDTPQSPYSSARTAASTVMNGTCHPGVGMGSHALGACTCHRMSLRRWIHAACERNMPSTRASLEQGTKKQLQRLLALCSTSAML